MIKFNSDEINALPENKPVVYKICDTAFIIIYVGSAKRGRVRDRIKEHLGAGMLNARYVKIEQFLTLEDARHKERILISQLKPVYNTRHTGGPNV